MDKKQFISLINEICRQMPDIEVRKAFLQNRFVQSGYSIDLGYKEVNYFYNELKKARDGEVSIYEKGSMGNGTIGHFPPHFSWFEGITCWLKITYEAFEGLEELFTSTPQTGIKAEPIAIAQSLPIETKTERLTGLLGQYGFFDLPQVKKLSETNITKLIEKISSNGLPYGIAMFDYLGFLKHLGKEHFLLKEKLNKEIADWFSVNNRAVKGNINVLNERSTDDKQRYTAHTHKENVKKDYQALK